MIPYYRVAIYVVITYALAFYLGHLTVPEAACVKVDEKIYCGWIQ